MTSKNTLVDDNFCFGCGSDNPIGLNLKFSLQADNQMKCSFVPQRTHQGFAGRVHGGIISLVFDEIAVNHVRALGFEAVSADMSLRLICPAKTLSVLTFTSKIIKQTRKVIRVQCYCSDSADGKIAEGNIVCVVL